MRRPNFNVVIAGLGIYLGLAMWIVWDEVQLDRPPPPSVLEELNTLLAGNWILIWIVASIYTTWRMHQASRLVRTMQQRGHSQRAPGLGSYRPIRPRDLVGTFVAMQAIAWLGGLALTAYDGWESHPASVLFGTYAAGAVAYLVSSALIGMVVNMSASRLELVPIPFHADRCNGFWPFGYLGLRNLLGASILLLALPQLSAIGLADDLSSSGLPMYGFLALYVVGFLWVLVSDLAMTVWNAHAVMKRHRENALAAISGKMTALLAASDRVGDLSDTELLRLAALETHHQVVRREYVEWPLGYRRFAGVTGLSVIVSPFIGAVIRRVID